LILDIALVRCKRGDGQKMNRIRIFAAMGFCSLVGFMIIGCEAGIPYAVGKSYLTKDRASSIRVTEDQDDTAGCDLIKEVRASTAWGGLALQDEAQERVISDITREAQEAGANVLLIKTKKKGFMGSSVAGEAYRCPESKPTVRVQ
jgi:hypothetical protein